MTVPALGGSTQSDELYYRFGVFTLRPDGTLLRNSAVLALPPKELAVLRLLLSQRGQIVAPDELRRSVWGGVHVSADSLPRCISSLRARLESNECIQTVYKRGYRFSLVVEVTSPLREVEPQVSKQAAVWTAYALPRLAIPPFTTEDGVPEFLGFGIAEETMLRLGRLRYPIADVLGRDSVFALAASGSTALEAGKMLSAELVVSGSIAALPLYYRLRAEMLRVSDGVQLWVEDFLVPRELVAFADARIAKRIAARIRTTFTVGAPSLSSLSSSDAVSGGAPAMMAGGVTVQHGRRSEAYLVEMRAKANWDTFRLPQMQEAIRDYRRALEIDPELHSARIHLMHCYLALATFGYLRADIAAEQARKHAETLLTQSDSAAHAALGWIHFFHDRDLDAAAAAFARPQNAGYNPWETIYQARFALGQGRLSDAVTLLRGALACDPFSAVLHWRLAWALHLAGDTDAALQQAEDCLRLFPNDPGALFFAAIIFAAASDPGSESSSRDLSARSVGLATHLIQIAPSLDGGYGTLAYAHARHGRIVEARALLDRQAWVSRERFVSRSFDAPALVELGEHDAALEVLATSERQHCPWLFELLGDPRLQPLHREPEFHRLGSLSGHSLVEKASVA